MVNKSTHILINKELELDEIKDIIDYNLTIELSEEIKNSISENRKFLELKIDSDNELYYGINTGFGSLCNHVISKDDLKKLQINLVRSHACGAGEEIDPVLVKLMLLLKIKALSLGSSGIQLATVERLIYLFNNNILPVVYESGSLGASGDLSPLAHISLVLIGEGYVNYNGNRLRTIDLYNEMGLTPVELESKEGLALLNGTQFMSAHAVHAILRAENLFFWLNKIAALSLDAFNCRTSPFDPLVHKLRPYHGQISTAATILDFLKGSELFTLDSQDVQDPYSFRCIPQVHGASFDEFLNFKKKIQIEINSVTDNPLIFDEYNNIISAGNFHGQPLALAMDFMAIAIAELGSISERRIYKLISGARGLPSFLVNNPGLNSGLMIPQYTAASMVSKNKVLCHPASIDSIDSSNYQEDHV